MKVPCPHCNSLLHGCMYCGFTGQVDAPDPDPMNEEPSPCRDIDALMKILGIPPRPASSPGSIKAGTAYVAGRHLVPGRLVGVVDQQTFDQIEAALMNGTGLRVRSMGYIPVSPGRIEIEVEVDPS